MATYAAHPDYVVPTGDFSEEWMEEEGINAAELARRLDVSRKHVSELLRGKAPLSHDMALRLENTTGVPAEPSERRPSGRRFVIQAVSVHRGRDVHASRCRRDASRWVYVVAGVS